MGIDRPILRRASWGVADQALSSLTNFGLGVLVARSVTAKGFGAFSIVFVTFTVGLGISRAVAAEPLMVRCSGAATSDWRTGTAQATGIALAVGLALGLACVMLGRALPEPFTGPFIALGVTLPGLLLQDCWRYVFFANADGRKAFANELLCAVVLGVAFAMLLRAGRRPSVSSLILAWGGAATIGALFGSLQARVLPAPRQLALWYSTHRDLIPRFLGEFAATSSAGQIAVYGVAAIAGIDALGSLRAAYLPFGPLQVLLLGAGLVAVPELVRLGRRSADDLRNGSAAISLTIGVVALAWGVLVALTPTRIGVAIFGSIWSPAHMLAFAVTLSWIGSALGAGGAAGLRALAAARDGLTVRIVASVVTIAAALIGAALDGARGAAIGLAAAGWIEGVVWWSRLRHVLRRRGHALPNAVPAPAAVRPQPVEL